MNETCKTCEQEIPAENMADELSISGMFDCHLFCRFSGNTVDEIIDAWRDQISKPYPAIVGGREVGDLGATALCPIIVLGNGEELRRVGPMVSLEWSTRQPQEDKLAKWRAAALADPDITKLLLLNQVG